MRYMLKYWIKNSPNKPVECDVHSTLSGALLDWETALKVHGEQAIKVATILQDQQGKDHVDNAGKFFLYRILK